MLLASIFSAFENALGNVPHAPEGNLQEYHIKDELVRLLQKRFAGDADAEIIPEAYNHVDLTVRRLNENHYIELKRFLCPRVRADLQKLIRLPRQDGRLNYLYSAFIIRQHLDEGLKSCEERCREFTTTQYEFKQHHKLKANGFCTVVLKGTTTEG